MFPKDLFSDYLKVVLIHLFQIYFLKEALLRKYVIGGKAISSLITNEKKFEPRHDKTNKVTMRPAKTQISQADLSLRWAHSHFVGFVMSRLIFYCTVSKRLSILLYSILLYLLMRC